MMTKRTGRAPSRGRASPSSGCRLSVLARARGRSLVVVLAAVFAPLLAPHDPSSSTRRGTAGPVAEHWFGHRQPRPRHLHPPDVRRPLVADHRPRRDRPGPGAPGRSSARSPRPRRKAVDETIMRLLDVVMAFPGIALAAVLVAVFGGGIPVLISPSPSSTRPPVARVVRANVLAQYGEDYVAAERVIGARTPHILVKHVAINCAAPCWCSARSWSPTPSCFEARCRSSAPACAPGPVLGHVIADGKNMVLLGGWWATVFPGLLISDHGAGAEHPVRGPHRRVADPSLKKTKKTALESASTAAAEETSTELILEDEAARDANTGVESTTSPTRASLHEALKPVPRRRHSNAPEPGGNRAARTDRLVSRATPLPARGTQPDDPLPGTLRRHRDRRRRHLHRPPGRGARPGRRVRLRQVAHLAGGHGPAAQDRRGHRRDPLRRRRTCSTCQPRQRRKLRGHDMAMIYQDALCSLNPAMTIRAQLKQLTRRGGTRTAEELLELVGLDPVRTLRQLPARAVRRPAPARADRDGAVPQPEADRRRRAHHRPRRHRPGAGHRPAQRLREELGFAMVLV